MLETSWPGARRPFPRRPSERATSTVSRRRFNVSGNCDFQNLLERDAEKQRSKLNSLWRSAKPRDLREDREEDYRPQHEHEPCRSEDCACLRDGQARLAGMRDLAHGHLAEDDGKHWAHQRQRDEAQDGKDETGERGWVEVGGAPLHGQDCTGRPTTG